MISRPTRALPGRSSTVAVRPGWRRHSAAEYQPCPPPMSSTVRGPGGTGTLRATSPALSRASSSWPVM